MSDAISMGALRHRQLEVDGSSIHVVEGGPVDGPAALFLHGWPESWAIYEKLMILLAEELHVVAIDLPGVGGSVGASRAHDKRTLAAYVHGVIMQLRLTDLTLVGHDVGGQIVYAYVHAYPDALRSAVMMNIVTPGVEPWSEVVRNPHLWHFAFHAVRDLPEKLVQGKEGPYFAYFYDLLAGPAGIDDHTRRTFVEAYTRPEALRAGFEWYRAFAQDEKDNHAVESDAVSTPMLYLRGDREGGDLGQYVDGLRAGGLRDVRGGLIPNSGHFSAHENPPAVRAALHAFMARPGREPPGHGTA
jgi:pimeloyl-ACP methyl ester carboxylesterase